MLQLNGAGAGAGALELVAAVSSKEHCVDMECSRSRSLILEQFWPCLAVFDFYRNDDRSPRPQGAKVDRDPFCHKPPRFSMSRTVIVRRYVLS